ncbi:MAG: carboxypeptidase regulatory-like domain-containing protein, partial [Vicinamibacteraceae bacterium]
MGGTARRVGSAVLVTLLGPALEIAAAQGGTPAQKPKVAKAVAHDTSRPLREMVGPSTSAQEADQARELPPRDNPSVRERYEQENRVLSMTPDPLRQIVTGQARAPDPTLNVEGPAGDDNFIHHQAPPPDANGDVGPNHWISMVNVLTSIYNKDGSIVLGPFPNRTFWKDFDDRCHYNQRAPIVLHDQLADRWLVSQPGSSGVECVAVSTGPDPTGTFHRYAFQFTDGFSDFPQLGLWPDGYYLSSNGLPRDDVGARPTSNTLCAFERDAMLEGNDAQIVCFQIAPLPNGDEFWLPQPAHLEGMTLPPTGAPHPFIMAYDDEVWGGNPDATQDFYKVWHFSVDWNDTANSTLTGPIDVPTAEFNSNQCGVFGSRKCVPQPDTDEMIDSLALYNSYRAVYRNFGAAHADGAHDSLWINHTVNVDGSGPPGLAGIRWAEVRNPLGNPTEHQAGTWSPPDGDHRFVGSLSVDDSGNMLLAYSVSSEDTFPSIRYAGRLARDPLGQLPQEENELWAGTGSQEYFYEWGRFSTVSLDESDGCSFWITNEYYEDAGEGWKTRVGATRFATCDAAEAGTIAGTLTTRDTGDRLAGVTIRAERGNGDIFETKTDEAGAYAILVPKGTYRVTAWKFGFIAETVTGIKVANETATTVDFRMRRPRKVDVDGFVTDGSGAGWPIYATVVITTQGADPLVLHTNTKNGYYLIEDLPANVAYTFTVTAITPAGYVPEERKVTTGARDRQENFALLVDDTCTTPGYALGDALVVEDFEGTFPPDGWRVTKSEDECHGELGTPGWNTENLIGRGNLTGGSGLFVIADAEACDDLMDTNLVTPELDLSSLGENDVIRISWNQDLLNTIDINDARVQAWDGAEWVTVADFPRNDRGPVRRHVITTVGAGLTNAKFRWHYGTFGLPRWWQVDNVELRAGSCQFSGSGGIIFGNVYDANTGDGIN